MDKKEPVELKIPFEPSTIESIDRAVMSFVNNLHIATDTNKGRKKVPVNWVSPERAFQSKKGEELRDKQGALILPLITVAREGITKDLARKGAVYSHIPEINDAKGGAIPTRRFVNQKKTANFANADARLMKGQINFPRPNAKVVTQTVSVPIPVYITCDYSIVLRTEYQQQLNEMMAPFIVKPGGINHLILRDGIHKYEAFVQSQYSNESNVSDFSDSERSFSTTVQIQVLGYIIGEEGNREKPFYAIRENIVEVKLPRERLIFGDIPEHEFGTYQGLPGLDLGSASPSIARAGFAKVSGVGRAFGGGTSGGTGGFISNNVDFINVFTEVYAIREKLTPIPDGANKVFTTSYNMKNNTETIFLNGNLIYPGEDYTRTSPNTITMIETPDVGELILATYVRDS
tara:strand:- start:839 stop:2047 length:1209 start_codon:yes stop_codon:yes gene_type:complete